jgi:hypothetical protein
MVTVANPIYDIVFKYLMEDERIARTILSTLLKEDVVRVELRPHEYANTKRDTLSVFRIDFGATIRKDDGTEQLILVELQKGGVQRLPSVSGGYPWLPTETLRFRQYIGVQYSNPENVVGEGRDCRALPMVAIYLLGHKVGDIEEPVIYVHNEPCDYDGNLVTKGLPDPFVSSLTHESIIVQIPRLRGKINNRLDEILSIFDQSQTNADTNDHTIFIDENRYAEEDAEMQRILRRLLMAAVSSDIRQDMNVEDEYYSYLEQKETEVMMKDRIIAQQDAQLSQQKEQLSQKDAQLSQQKEQLSRQETQLRASIKMLLDAGLPPAKVAESLGIDVADNT